MDGHPLHFDNDATLVETWWRPGLHYFCDMIQYFVIIMYIIYQYGGDRGDLNQLPRNSGQKKYRSADPHFFKDCSFNPKWRPEVSTVSTQP